MKIVVFIKQVPDNTRLRFQNGQVVTDGVPTMMNPFDEYALETALRLREQAGADSAVLAVSLGVATVRETLKKAIAAGAHQALLISDPAFDNLDSAPVAATLAAAVQKHIPDFDVLVFGQLALDDAAMQVGPRVAALLDVPSVTLVKDAKVAEGSTEITAFRETARGLEEWVLSGRAALCVMKCDYELRASNIKGVMKANKAEIPTVTAADLELSGKLPVPTLKTLKTYQRPAKTAGKVINGDDPKGAVEQLLGYLHESKVL